MLTTFGPGAMLDLPEHSVMIAGLDYWRGDKERVYESRLEAWLAERLSVPELKLFAPPAESGDDGAARTGVDVFLFPVWFLGQVDETWETPRTAGSTARGPCSPGTGS
jgi:hypothetical protein